MDKWKKALNAYINNDLECTEASYVIGVLRDQCGLSDEDIAELGLEVIEEDDDDNC